MSGQKSSWKNFLKLCAEVKSPEEFNKLFDLILTFEEKETIASRYLIIKSLLEGKLTQREISEKCKVSIAQITRGSNALKIASQDIKNLLKNPLK